MIGRLVNNSISPRVGSFNLVVSSLYGCSILIFVMLKIETFAGLAVFAVLYGFTSGACKSSEILSQDLLINVGKMLL